MPRAKQKVNAENLNRKILLTGATGYIGGRLLGILNHEGFSVRCMTRRPDALQHVKNETTEIVPADALDKNSLRGVFKGIDTAFYLIHSLGSKEGFVRQDQQAARNFGEAAAESGVQRIIYLGGLANADEKLSDHLRSRIETGERLRAGGVPVIEFRASIILGSGSLSFEMIRTLVEKLPVMTTPRWVKVKAQPIGVNDVLAYLLAALSLKTTGNKIYEIGGSDQLSYMDIMREYARQRGLKRFMIPVPVLTPKLSSYWLGLVTPLYARIGRKLIDGVRYPTVVKDHSALEDFEIRPKSTAEAIAEALRNEDSDFAVTHWSDALSSSGCAPPAWGGVKFGNRIIDSRTRKANVPARIAFIPIARIGGETGWYYANLLWRLRGFIDLLVGGVGLRRGRKNLEELHVGDPLDFWRVEVYEPGHRLRLAAEMKLPGRAWLDFEVTSISENESEIRQTAIFDPIGLSGILYWKFSYPFHLLIFSGMLRNITKAVKKEPQ